MFTYYAVVDSIAELISHFDDRYKAFAAAILMFVASLALWLGWLRRDHRRFMRMIDGTARELRRIADGKESVANKLAAADKRIKAVVPLSTAWKPYRRSLRDDPRLKGELTNPISPYTWFSLDRLPGRGYEKWASTFAGVFLTVGLLFTFIGLSAALFKVGGLGGDTDQLRTAIFEILKISSAKFITSIAGILAYIGWTVAARQYAAEQSKAAGRLADAVQMLSIPVTPEALLLDQAIEAREQTERLRTLADEIKIGFQDTLTSVIAQRLDALPAAVAPAFTQSLEPVVDAIRGMGSSIGSGNEAAIRSMVDEMNKSLNQAAGAEMEMVARAIREAADELRSAKSGIGDSGTEFNQKMSDAADRLSATVASMSDMMDRRMGDLEGRIRRIDDSFSSGAQNIETVSGQMAAGLRASLDEAVRQVQESASAASLAAREGVQTQMGSVLQSLRDLVDEIRQSALSSRNELVEGSRSAAAELGGAVLRVGDDLSKASKSAADSLEAAFSRATGSMVQGAEGALGRFGEVAGALSSSLQSVERSVSAVDAAVRRHAERMDQTNAMMAQSGSTIATASDALRQATAPVRGTLELVEAATRHATLTLETIKSTGDELRTALDAMQTASSAANEAFRSYEQRFGTVDDRLANTLARLRDGMVELGDRVTAVVRDYDEHLARGMSGLSQGVASLGDMVNDIGDVCGGIEKVAMRIERSASGGMSEAAD